VFIVLLFQVEVVEHPEKKRRVTIPSLDSEALASSHKHSQHSLGGSVGVVKMITRHHPPRFRLHHLFD